MSQRLLFSTARSVLPVWSLLFVPFGLLRRFGARPLFFASSSQNSRQRIVAFVTGVFVEVSSRRVERHFATPWFFPGGWIFYCELVQDLVLSDPREAFDELRVLRRAAEALFRTKIHRFDDQRIAFPAPHRIAHPLLDATR